MHIFLHSMYGCRLSKHGMIWKNKRLVICSAAECLNSGKRWDCVFAIPSCSLSPNDNFFYLYILLYWSSSRWLSYGIYLWVRSINVNHWLFAGMLLFRNSPSWLEVGISQDRNNLLVSLPRDPYVSNLFHLVIGIAAGVGQVKWSERISRHVIICSICLNFWQFGNFFLSVLGNSVIDHYSNMIWRLIGVPN